MEVDLRLVYKDRVTKYALARLVVTQMTPTDRCVICLKAQWALALSHLTFAEIPLNPHMTEWDPKECHKAQEGVVTLLLAEAGGIQGSIILRWLTPNHRTSADPRTVEAYRICNIKEDHKVLIQVPQILQPAVLQ